MSSMNKNSLKFSFSIPIPFLSFSSLIALDRTSSTVLKRNIKRGNSYLVLDLKGKASSCLPLHKMLIVDNLYQVEEVPFYS